jgi:pilus assembly protein CpaC
MRRILPLGALALAALLLVAVPGRLLAAVELLGGAPSSMTLEVSKGQLVRLEAAAASVFIADPEIADVEVMSPRLIYLFARAPGDTNLLAVGENDEVIVNLRLSVRQNVEGTGSAVAAVAPSGADLTPADDDLVLSGTVDTANEAADIERVASAFVEDPTNIINRLQVNEPNQVNLRVRFAEVSRDVIRNIGINWESIFDVGSFTFGLATGADVFTAGGVLRGTSGNAVFGSYSSGDADINVLLDALEQQNLVSILAEPNLTAVSGETASFLAGGEFPVPVAQDSDQISVEFKEFGVSLAFTPTIIGNGRINMRVRPEVSQLSTTGGITIGGLPIASLTTRRAETTIEVGSGQSFAIAGLFQSTITQENDGLAGLADLPILGRLFRSERFRRNQTELVIVVTPYLVQPVRNPGDIVVPNDRMYPATPGSPLAHDSLAAIAAASRTGVGGSAGFILK